MLDAEAASTNARTLARGLTLLEGVARQRSGASVTDLAAEAGIDKGTASRLLTTMRRLGYLRQNKRDRRYLLTGKVLMLARSYDRQLNLIGVARPVLTRLRQSTSQTIYLAVREGNHVLYVDQYDPESDIRLAHAVGRSLPLHVTAMGRAILAAMPEDECESLLAELLRAPNHTNFSVDVEHVRDEIARARHEGWATVDRFDDVTRIGAALIDVSGEPVGAISVAGPTFLVVPHIDSFSRLCTAAAKEIGELIAQ